MNRSTLLLVPLLGLVACSAQNIQDRWVRFVSEHDACQVASDCVLVYPGCPLGCYDAVSTDAEQEANDYAAKLIRQYESIGRSCDYSCLEPPDPQCDAGHCALPP